MRRACAAGLVLAAALAPGPLLHAQTDGPPPFVHDPTNGDAARLQRPAEAFRSLPRDKRGAVDWMAALRQRQITPRASLEGDQPMELLHLDVLMKNTREMPHVKFPHEAHTQWLACSNCHDRLFVPRAGANAITMAAIFQGRFCGTCHGTVAFTTLFDCERCHSVPHGDIPAWW